jgi:ABC-type glycerol-3-phosphate transport system substrate-binding protein
MRLWLTLVSLALFCTAAASAGAAQSISIAELAAYNKPDREKVLYDGAKKEGKLMWYTSLTGGPNTDAPKVFEAKYPGIKLEVYRSDSDGIIQRVMQEAQAKRYIVDSIETTFPILKVMQENNLLRSILMTRRKRRIKGWYTGPRIASPTSACRTTPIASRPTRRQKVSTICSNPS